MLVDTLAASGGTDTLIGGAGNDTIKGQQGDFLQDTGSAGSHNEFWLYAGGNGNSTLQGGAGNDTFHIELKQVGNDTIIGGGGHDTVDFDQRAFSDVSDIQVQGSGPGHFTYTLDVQRRSARQRQWHLRYPLHRQRGSQAAITTKGGSRVFRKGLRLGGAPFARSSERNAIGPFVRDCWPGAVLL